MNPKIKLILQSKTISKATCGIDSWRRHRNQCNVLDRCLK